MTWTKGTFEMVAKVIATQRHILRTQVVTGQVDNYSHGTLILDALADAFALKFKDDNPRFNMARFLDACKQP